MIDPELRKRVPAHVRDDQIVEYDYVSDPRIAKVGDVQLGMHLLHEEAPDVFYSPCNGGFWVVSRLDIMSKILPDTEHFSNKELVIPRIVSDAVMIPLNLDPPEHLQYRLVLMRHFDPKSIRAMEPFIRAWANKLIDKVIAQGHCEFAEEIGAAFPVSVFMELMGYPLDQFEEFRRIVHAFFAPETTPEERVKVQTKILETVAVYFDERRKAPRDDLVSKLLQEKVWDRPLTTDELNSIGFLLFLAGLDTVANTLSFTFNYLAQDQKMQERLGADPEIIPSFVEEALRRFSIVQQPRLVKKDVEINGAQMKAGEMVVCSLPLAGMDDHRNPMPEVFDVDRKDRAHLAFSVGPHTCVGNQLARLEMRILTEEWIKRIPRFWRKAGTEPERRIGGVAALSNLYLEWPKPH
ncbi:cytochrome P450 [Terricaulis sp.]|uniref:cytochrome P450 n=1 Tax=Terricaulis sp. TaxID=2768686 RepID=UPI0037845456